MATTNIDHDGVGGWESSPFSDTNYGMESRELIEINGIVLPVLPTDISYFSDNKVYEEPYIRAPGAITFRSKHSESLVTMSFAFSIMELATPDNYDPLQRDIAERGLQLISSLNSYPFCFIKSNRLDSYLGLHTATTKDDNPLIDKDVQSTHLMFGVKKISISQDARVPGVLLLEVQLLFNNHRILTPNLDINFNRGAVTFKTIDGNAQDCPMDFKQFLEIMSKDALDNTKLVLQSSSEALAPDNFNTSNVLSQVRILVPDILNLEEYGVTVYPESDEKTKIVGADLTGNIENLPFDAGGGDDKGVIFFRMPNPLQTPALYVNQKDYSETEEYKGEMETSEWEKDPLEIAETNANAHPIYAVYWQEDSFAYDNNINAIQNIVIEKERAFASHMIGAYQHPLLQYMGHYPARLTISSSYLGNNYDESKSIHYLFKIMTGVIDSINVRYPLANAFNYVKIFSLATAILDINKFIPHQSQIEASSQMAGLEAFTCMFVENSMDKMLEVSKVNIGRETISTDNNIAIESTIREYLNNLSSYIKSGKTLTSAEESLHHTILSSIVNVTKAMTGEVDNMTISITSSMPTAQTNTQITTPSENKEETPAEGGE